MTNPIILLGIVLMIVSAAVCFNVAKSKGLRKHYWCAMGLMFGPFAIPFVFIANP